MNVMNADMLAGILLIGGSHLLIHYVLWETLCTLKRSVLIIQGLGEVVDEITSIKRENKTTRRTNI